MAKETEKGNGIKLVEKMQQTRPNNNEHNVYPKESGNKKPGNMEQPGRRDKKTPRLHNNKRKLQKVDKECEDERTSGPKTNVPTQNNHNGDKHKTKEKDGREWEKTHKFRHCRTERKPTKSKDGRNR